MFTYRDICDTRPDAYFFLAPTTPRTKPFWFASEQSNISLMIQSQLQKHHPRLLPLPGFQTDPTSLDTDGIHFSALAGIAYCQHLIDSARYYLATPTSPFGQYTVIIYLTFSIIYTGQIEINEADFVKFPRRDNYIFQFQVESLYPSF
jgi:hypothetical protein